MRAAITRAAHHPRGLHIQTPEAVVHHQKHPQNCGGYPVETAEQQADVPGEPHCHGATTPQNHKQEVGRHQHQELRLQRVLVLRHDDGAHGSHRRVRGEEARASCQCRLAFSHRRGEGGSCAFLGYAAPQAKHSAQEIDPGHQHDEASRDKERAQTGAPHQPAAARGRKGVRRQYSLLSLKGFLKNRGTLVVAHNDPLRRALRLHWAATASVPGDKCRSDTQMGSEWFHVLQPSVRGEEGQREREKPAGSEGYKLQLTVRRSIGRKQSRRESHGGQRY
ncbi:hypothetical protein EYF80_034194 [Liparis tanakae]|uniref:Uncharacterized protein n=1 Tax=Liparis tanakae TaxID=230148 RepID=A0A4Z2GPW8_9TELE|nr:hypothetical protein EYF80_034194 [Liparis tanakae]